MADLLPVRTAHKVTLLNKNETNEGKKKSVNKINRLPNGNFNQDTLFLLLFVQASFWSSKSWCLEHTAVESAKAQARVWQSRREWQLLRAHKVALIANPWLCKINYYPSDQNTLFSVTVVGINDNKIKKSFTCDSNSTASIKNRAVKSSWSLWVEHPPLPFWEREKAKDRLMEDI